MTRADICCHGVFFGPSGVHETVRGVVSCNCLESSTLSPLSGASRCNWLTCDTLHHSSKVFPLLFLAPTLSLSLFLPSDPDRKSANRSSSDISVWIESSRVHVYRHRAVSIAPLTESYFVFADSECHCGIHLLLGLLRKGIGHGFEQRPGPFGGVLRPS